MPLCTQVIAYVLMYSWYIQAVCMCIVRMYVDNLVIAHTRYGITVCGVVGRGRGCLHHPANAAGGRCPL